MRRNRTHAAVISALCLVTVLAGCDGSEPAPAADARAFTAAGPWAAAFAEAAAETSAYQRQILSDGIVTAQELADAQTRTTDCMRDLGYDHVIDDDGTSEASPMPGHAPRDAETVNGFMTRCAGEYSSDVGYLFGEVRRNPEKLDEAEITVACLRDAGIVDDAYSERTWRDEEDVGRFSFPEWSAAAVQCRLDPLGLWRES